MNRNNREEERKRDREQNESQISRTRNSWSGAFRE
jgi:hypothetical protein